MQFDDAGEDAKLDEDCEIDVDDEAESRRKLETQKKDITKNIINCLHEASKKVCEDISQKELAQIEQRENDLLPEHEKYADLVPTIAKPIA